MGVNITENRYPKNNLCYKERSMAEVKKHVIDFLWFFAKARNQHEQQSTKAKYCVKENPKIILLIVIGVSAGKQYQDLVGVQYSQ